MCKHYWMLGMTTPTGTPAHCKLCGEKRVFRAKGSWWTQDDASERKHPPPIVSRARTDQLPFNPHRYEPRVGKSRLRGVRK